MNDYRRKVILYSKKMESSAWKQYNIPQQLHFQPEKVFPSALIFCYEDSLSTKFVKENKRKDNLIFSDLKSQL